MIMGRGNETIGKMAVCLIVLSLGIPFSADAGLYWQDNFENHLTPNWDTSACGSSVLDGCNPSISSNTARGNYSLLSRYPGNHVGAGAYYDRPHSSTTEVWTRFYYYTANFVYDAQSGTKQFFTQSPLGSWVIWENFFGSREMSASINTQDNILCTMNGQMDQACTYYPNMSHVPFNDNTWYCVETHVKANSGNGATNGVLEIFVNGTQTVGYSNIPLFTRAVDGYNMVRVYAQYGQGDRYFDDFAVGNTRIGCGGTDAAPPARPTGLTVK